MKCPECDNELVETDHYDQRSGLTWLECPTDGYGDWLNPDSEEARV